eukprot:TRINITY_DN5755_c0_g2_i2.p1 TRINITY_DN5755_c0_g2~~TRINITY_DN5755_c0_g2_i2.p1  ORF type:complete len:199 (+),score=35.16 TRINITY_DN5755_c0_g2_i2:185-781(+)
MFSRLERHTVFNKEQLRSFQSSFRSFFEASGQDGVSLAQFLAMMQQCAPHIEAGVAERFFRIYDTDNSGYVDFKEIVCCLSVLCEGSSQEKMRLCFDVYDRDHSGFLEEGEIDAMAASLCKMLNIQAEEKQRFADKLKAMDLDKDRQITFTEFAQGVQSEPQILSAFQASNILQDTDASIQQSISKMASKEKKDCIIS